VRPSWRREYRSETPTDIKAQIASEIYAVFERLGADVELLAIVGSWRDALPDEQVLVLPSISRRALGPPTFHRTFCIISWP